MKRRARVLAVSVWASCWIGSACGDPGYQLDGGAEPFVNEDHATGSKQTPNKSSGDAAAAGKRAQANAGSGGRTSNEVGGSAARAGREASTGGKGGAPSAAAGRGTGSGGSAAGSGGSGGRSGAPSGSTKFGDPVACAPCEAKIPADNGCHGARELCLGATGTAAHGPKAGAPLGQLCAELVACIWSTGCGSGTQSSGDKGNWTNCLCGKGVDCLVTNEAPKGACKDQILAATETTDLAQVNNRLYDLSLASGFAVQTVECDAALCAFECGICVPESGASAAGDETCHPASNDADAGI